jgi:hypothetical protein
MNLVDIPLPPPEDSPIVGDEDARGGGRRRSMKSSSRFRICPRGATGSGLDGRRVAQGRGGRGFLRHTYLLLLLAVAVGSIPGCGRFLLPLYTL